MTIELTASKNYPGRTALHHRTHPESNSTTIIDLTDEDMTELKTALQGRTVTVSVSPETAMRLRGATIRGYSMASPTPGLYELTELARELPEGSSAQKVVAEVLRRPYAAAYALVKIAAQLGARPDWSGADELEQIGETIRAAALPPLDEEALYQDMADQMGIYYTPEEGDDDAE